MAMYFVIDLVVGNYNHSTALPPRVRDSVFEWLRLKFFCAATDMTWGYELPMGMTGDKDTDQGV